MITTDGHENSSKRFTYSQIKKTIEAKKEIGWEFLFLGANIDAIGEAEKMGISRNRAVTYENDKMGIATNYKVIGDVLCRYRAIDDECDSLFDGDWAKEIEDYHEEAEKKKKAKKKS